MRVCIVAPNASALFGGEAILPLHYFKGLRKRGVDTYMITHARNRNHLKEVTGEDIGRIFFVEDTRFDIYMNKIVSKLPRSIGLYTFGFASNLFTQIRQKKLLKKVVKNKEITVVHEPAPVSPKLPSMIYDVGAPVVIGPMNGGMVYPAPFRHDESLAERLFIRLGRSVSKGFNALIPGKKKAAYLLVANERTKGALAVECDASKVITLVENGVDLDLFNSPTESKSESSTTPLRLIFLGRLVNWKGVNYLIEVMSRLKGEPVHLEIVGDGPEKANLQQQTEQLNLTSQISFAGFLPQSECKKRLENSSALVLPSLFECGGAVVLEAMAMRKAVIATAWGGPTDYLDETCGILIDPTNSIDDYLKGFENAIRKLIKEPDLAKTMGQHGAQKIQSHFSWSKKIDAILEVYGDATLKQTSTPIDLKQHS